MYDNFIINKFYEEDEFHLIDNILLEGTWVDNSKTITMENEKYHLSEDEIFKTELNLNSIFLEKTQDDFTFYSFCVPNSNSQVNIFKLKKKSFFRIHHESILQGDYATEIALNNPEEYEGGELCLFIEGKEMKFKLPKGFGITYKTGILTQTNTVTHGEKITANFYTNSLFKDDKIRSIYSKLLYLNSKFEVKPVVATYEEAVNDPNYIIGEIKDYFINNFANNKK